jgi:hypothetical protein
MNYVQKFVLFGTLAIVLLGSPTINATTATNAIGAAACAGRHVTVPGAEAHWTECKSNGWTTVSGWVKDTRADSRCGQVYAIFTNGAYHQTKRACPKGNIKDFSWREHARDASIYLRTVPASS